MLCLLILSYLLLPPSLPSSGWGGYELRDLFHHSQWYRLRSCALLGVREADTPTLLPNIALEAPGSADYVPYANYDSSYLHWCTDGRQVCVSSLLPSLPPCLCPSCSYSLLTAFAP